MIEHTSGKSPLCEFNFIAHYETIIKATHVCNLFFLHMHTKARFPPSASTNTLPDHSLPVLPFFFFGTYSLSLPPMCFFPCKHIHTYVLSQFHFLFLPHKGTEAPLRSLFPFFFISSTSCLPVTPSAHKQIDTCRDVYVRFHLPFIS